ncbi:hypothetical protein PACTADRAFT_48054 [Pachysolen tannophilus NRRL Y-2460]|uniref:Myb-like domain-containing protein n=1 Tax=Pachysolen tannophilus NRRL Y-2460 TaxID=669874 RepID=A0A1E4U2N6_PACTA|nr:hypothetical protein PACTADRAFT_48054 [Pachysolen tannophilus NRRL Y-2460]
MDVSDPIECGTSIHARQSSSRLDVTSPVGYDVKYKKSRLESPATTNHRIQRLEEGDDYLDHSKVSIIQKIPRRSGRSRRGEDPLPEVKSKSKVKIVGTHTFQSVQNKKLRKETPKKDKKIKRWTKEEDDLIIFQKEALKKSWKDIELLLDRKHSWQAIQMRYLRCHKQRNNEWSDFDEQRLLDKISEDYENRFKRLAVELGPSFNSERIYAKINELAKSEGNVPRLIKVYYDTADEDEDDIDDEDKVDEEEDEDDEDDEEEDEEEDDDDEEDGGEEEDDGEEDDEEEEDGDDDDVVVEEEEQEEDNEEDRDDDRNDKAKIKNGQINGREY